MAHKKIALGIGGTLLGTYILISALGLTTFAIWRLLDEFLTTFFGSSVTARVVMASIGLTIVVLSVLLARKGFIQLR